MRHFAEALREKDVRVDYVKLDEPENTGSFTGEVERAIQRHGPDRLVVTEAGEWRVQEMIEGWSDKFGIPVEIREDDRFLCSRQEFAEWAEGKKQLRMEFFYREMRRKTGWLMADGKPVGGQWNYDSDNRQSLPKKDQLQILERNAFKPDVVTHTVMDLVEERFSDHFGELEGFAWAVTREDALKALNHFITHKLPRFGDYQDAMKTGEDFLFHSIISPYLNVGLLDPREVCEAALEAYDKENAELNCVEGFVRQILGWREFVRGIYWMEMPEYPDTNYLNAHNKLPAFYWTGDTDMNCLRQAIEATKRNAYAHHIQRLMVTGNFALLAGISPKEVEEWYLLVYADALDWVELPNTHGMVLHADGGILGSKPYAASGAYINRMSDYCTGCKYNPRDKLGETACPLNYLYWNFIMANEEQLGDNPRMSMPYRNLKKMSDARKQEIAQASQDFLEANGIVRS
ncbi:MAG: cryptochrome/photolyase family protein [Verrucomicrobiae bacterium]|nr:cryptochrome/photolyase family protein [Verrucomicrobiae bacterium]